MIPPEFHFLRPEWFWALLPLAWLLWRLGRGHGGAQPWRGLVDAHLLPHLLTGGGGPRRRWPLALLALSWLLAVTALAGPVWQRLPQPVYQARAERVILLDLSREMNATDVAPSRLARARFEVLDLLKRLREGQTALIAYAAEPYVVSPLTADTRTIAAQVPSLDSRLLPVTGPKRTDLALQRAGELLSQAGSRHGEVILVTDGLDHPAAAEDAARELRDHGHRVSVLGVGSAEGAPVPLPEGGFLTDADGAITLPRLDAGELSALARAGGGRYLAATLDDRDVEALAKEAAADATPGAPGDTLRSADQWQERGPWLLLALLPLAALGLRRGWLGPALLLVCLLPAPPAAHAFGWDDLWLRADQQASRAFAQGHHAEAASRFRRPDWRAAAHYQSGDYDQALADLRGRQGPEADYNRGNVLARQGRLRQAIAAYDQALAADPDNADARHNRELLQRLLKQQQKSGGSSGRGEPEQSGDQSKRQSGGQGGARNGDQQGAGQQAKSGQGGDRSRSSQHQNGKGGKDHAKRSPQQGQNDRGQSAKANQAAGQSEQSAGARPQDAGDDQDRARAGARQQAQNQAQAESGAARASGRQDQRGREPGQADLLPPENGRSAASGAPSDETLAAQDPAERERQQSMERMLRRVPDDPAGLLRQRFLLQHLRRIGRL